MSTGTSAALYVDGRRFADGTGGIAPGDPVALAGLRVAWGRDTTVDQPGPSTCSFTVADSAGGASFIDVLHTGAPVAVTATGVDYPAPAAPTFIDPGFESDPLAVYPQNAAAAASSRQLHSGARSLRVLPEDGLRRWTVVLPPAPFAPSGTDAGAWDAIPQTEPGQTWRAGLWVRAPAGVVVAVQPMLFSGPWSHAGRPVGPSVAHTGAGAWQFVGTPVQADVLGSWMGLRVSAYPTGPAWSAAPGTWAELDPALTWEDVAAVYLDDVEVLAPAGGTSRTVLVFAGRITSVAAKWDDAVRGPSVDVVASDFTADLANRDVGDEPWQVEPMADRFRRILALAGLPVTADIDASVSGTPVSWADVDNQPAAGLLQGLATSVDAVMWPATHQTTGAYLRVEDPSQRVALFRLELVDGLVQVVPVTGVGHELQACDVLRDPIEFQQDVSDVVTRAAVSWLEQTVDQDGKPGTKEHTELVVSAPLEARLGTRRIGVTTQLVSADDARDVANRLMARLAVRDWRADGFVLDDILADAAGTMLQLLDGTSRIGLPLRVTGMPEWSPAGPELPLFLEGGSYHYAGRWVLDLGVSSARGVGESATWAELDPAWRWIDVHPDMTWADAYGAAGPEMSTL
jgi:hypothetical protein